MSNKRIGEYTLIKKIGKGGQATVWKALDSEQREVAIKKMSVTGDEDNAKSYEREMAIMKLVKHKYLVKSITSFKEENYYYLVYEYCPCDLLSLLQKQPGNRFPEPVARKWIKQLVEVMAHLNKLKIIHRDLKPENILLSEDSLDSDIRLADFGLARQGLTTRSFVGTLEYASPEIKNCQDYSYNTDVWSLGVILFASLYGKLPILNGTKLMYPPNTIDIPDGAKQFIEACLIFNYHSRPNFEELLTHPYINTNSEKFKKINEDLKIIQDPIQEELENKVNLPSTKIDIENFLLETYFKSSDVLEFAEKLGQEMQFIKYLVAKHFTDKFKYILENLLTSPHVSDFDQEFFEQFFSKSEKIINVCNQIEGSYKNLSYDDEIAFSFQIEELIASRRGDAQDYILIVLQEVSENLRKNTN